MGPGAALWLCPFPWQSIQCSGNPVLSFYSSGRESKAKQIPLEAGPKQTSQDPESFPRSQMPEGDDFCVLRAAPAPLEVLKDVAGIDPSLDVPDFIDPEMNSREKVGVAFSKESRAHLLLFQPFLLGLDELLHCHVNELVLSLRLHHPRALPPHHLDRLGNVDVAVQTCPNPTGSWL